MSEAPSSIVAAESSGAPVETASIGTSGGAEGAQLVEASQADGYGAIRSRRQSPAASPIAPRTPTSHSFALQDTVVEGVHSDVVVSHVEQAPAVETSVLPCVSLDTPAGQSVAAIVQHFEHSSSREALPAPVSQPVVLGPSSLVHMEQPPVDESMCDLSGELAEQVGKHQRFERDAELQRVFDLIDDRSRKSSSAQIGSGTPPLPSSSSHVVAPRSAETLEAMVADLQTKYRNERALSDSLQAAEEGRMSYIHSLECQLREADAHVEEIKTESAQAIEVAIRTMHENTDAWKAKLRDSQASHDSELAVCRSQLLRLHAL